MSLRYSRRHQTTKSIRHEVESVATRDDWVLGNVLGTNNTSIQKPYKPK